MIPVLDVRMQKRMSYTVFVTMKAQEEWRKWIGDHLWQQWQGMNCAEWIHHNLSRGNVKIEHGLSWDAAFAAICCFIWLARKKVIFEGDNEWITAKEAMLRFHLADAAFYSRNNSLAGTMRREQFIGWKRPPTGYIKINVDGLAKGAPGYSTTGGLCRDSTAEISALVSLSN
ncbi:hypothetical protein SLEP1_g45158 [Rubroshorea leprosula]|uniref:RNase H type-1 domain-containing protein n=1 Tax=Rubroshorea leprosula TaxID=152421 RepID=A0AAV5LIH3_9ROSI|nr:hypothetical protein SLEP1_g45158 [Rubroshorea leprosula]